MVIRAVEVVVEVVVGVASIQVIISRDLVGDMVSSLVVTEDNRVVMATRAMEVCTDVGGKSILLDTLTSGGVLQDSSSCQGIGLSFISP
jgi:hypothetical protein